MMPSLGEPKVPKALENRFSENFSAKEIQLLIKMFTTINSALVEEIELHLQTLNLPPELQERAEDRIEEVKQEQKDLEKINLDKPK